MLATVGKIVLVILNMVFMLIGLALLVIGALLAFVPGSIFSGIFDTAIASAKAAQQNVPNSVNDISNMPMIHEIGVALFVLGIIFTLISFLGCCGACYSCCKFLLIGFVIILIALMIGEIVVCSLFYVKDSTLHDNIRSQLKDQLKNYNETDTSDTFSQTINLIQVYFDCCGIDSFQDYSSRPRTCDTNNVGCYTKLTDIIQDNLLYAGLITGGILSCQLVEVIFAIIIFKKNKILPI